MSWNNIPSDERLRLWKTLRINITDKELSVQMEEIAKFFASMPFGARTMNYYDPADWLTPWEILYHGSYCKSSISLLIFYTFLLLKTEHKIELHLIDDSNEVYLLPVIDDQFVLNYELGRISNYSDVCTGFVDKQTFDKTQIKQLV